MKAWLNVKSPDSLVTKADIAVAKIATNAIWQEACSFKADSGIIFQTVPLADSSSKIYNDEQIVKRFFVIQKKGKEILESYIIELFGSKAAISNNSNLIIQNYGVRQLEISFTGNITKYSLKEKFKESIDYSAGRLKTRHTLMSRQVTSNKAIQGIKTSGSLVCTDWWLVTSRDGNILSVEYLYTTCNCDEQFVNAIRDKYGVQNFKTQGDCGGGDGGGGGSGGGGGGGGGGCPAEFGIKGDKVVMSGCNVNPQVAQDTMITSEFAKNVKAMCALNKLAISNQYKNFLNSFIGDNKPIDLAFNVQVIPERSGYITYGTTTPIPLSWNADMIQITLNANRIDSLPSLMVALTLLHEGIHAEIFRKLISIQGPSNLNIDNFPSLFNNYAHYKQVNDHEFIADYYIQIMSATLMQYDNYKFDSSFYEALSWQGLMGTDAWKARSDTSSIKTKMNQLLSGRSKIGCND